MKPQGILETALYVDDLAKAEDFYIRILGLKLNSKNPDRHLFLECGGTMLLLFDADKTKIKTGPVPTHGADGSGHVAFKIGDNEFDAWKKHLTNSGVEIETEVDWPKEEREGKSIYFRDPAGNSLELTTPHIWGLE